MTYIGQRFAPFVIFSMVYIIINYFTNTLILTDTFYQNILIERLSNERITELINKQNKIRNFVYFLIPVVLYVKIIFSAFTIYIAMVLSDINIDFNKLFKICLYAEIIFLVNSVFRFSYFIFNSPKNTKDIIDFAPLSLAQILNYKYPSYCSYFFQTINLFEFIYILLLIHGIRVITSFSRKQAVNIVILGYGSGLVLFVLIVTFIQISN
jgi:hypothetical protein